MNGTTRGLSKPPRPPQAFALGMDLGGTKALVGAFDTRGRLLFQRRYRCADFDGPLPILRDFLAALAVGRTLSPPARLCVGLAGPVAGRRARMTHLPWTLDATALGASLGVPRVELVNDCVAAAAGVAALGRGAVRSVQRGRPVRRSSRLVIGAGTGLGCAFLLPEAAAAAESAWRILPGEGGHAGFAPRDATEAALLAWLRGTGGHVPVEHIVSGPGIARIYAFLRARAGLPAQDALLDCDDPPSAISSVALQRPGTNPQADAALDLFASAFGACAGDLALACLPRGGVYLAGGVAAQVFDPRRTACFLRAFLDKGVHARLMRALPVRLVLSDALGLKGAGVIATGRAAVG